MKIKVNGQDVEADEVQVMAVSEPWASALLENGDTVRLKTVFKRIYRIRGVFDTSGAPVYFSENHQVFDTKIQPSNMKPPEDPS